MDSHLQENILDFVKSGYDLLWDHKKELEKKAVSLLTASGTIITLVFGFSAFLFKEGRYGEVTFFLGLSLICGILTILMSIFTLRLRKYDFIVAHEPDKGHDLDDIIKEYLNGENEVMQNTKIKSYVEGIKTNTVQNTLKGRNLAVAMWSFFATIFFLSLSVLDLFFLAYKMVGN